MISHISPPEPPKPKTMTLCSRCESAMRSKNIVIRLDSCRPTRLRGCQLCHERTYCGEYEVTEKTGQGHGVVYRTAEQKGGSADA